MYANCLLYFIYTVYYNFLTSERKSHFVHGKRPLLKPPPPPNGHWPFCVTKVGMDVVPKIKRESHKDKKAVYKVEPTWAFLLTSTGEDTRGICNFMVPAGQVCPSLYFKPAHFLGQSLLSLFVFKKGPVKLIQWVKIADSFLQPVSNQFHFIILS